MNILILSGSFGMGHNNAADAIKEDILQKNLDANINIIDMVDFIFPKSSRTIYRYFNLLVSKFSFLYNFFNKIAAKRASAPLKKTVVKKIDKLLSESNVDMIISTFPICTQYMSTYKKMKKSNIPLYTYITDICSNEEWIGEKNDKYFVGCEEIKDQLISKGIESNQVVVCGIPVKKAFKEINYTNNISSKKEILIMGGGLGLVPSEDKLLETLCKIENININFITGKNEKLLEEIKLNYPQINAIGYTDKVDEYMKKADLLITKAGGITLFEAIYTDTPLYVIRPFLSQEIGNAKFIEESQIGKVIWTKGTDINEDIKSLIKNDILLEDMKNNMKLIKEQLKSTYPLEGYEKEVVLCL